MKQHCTVPGCRKARSVRGQKTRQLCRAHGRLYDTARVMNGSEFANLFDMSLMDLVRRVG